MYKQAKKSKENNFPTKILESRAVANSVGQKKNAKNQDTKQPLTNSKARQLSALIQRQITDDEYNTARITLVNAGSNSARASHIKHTRGGSPDGHGRQLVSEAIQEFRLADAGGNVLTRGMTMNHFVAVSNAATEMNLDVEDIFTWMRI